MQGRKLKGHDASIIQNLKSLDAALKDSRKSSSDIEAFISKTQLSIFLMGHMHIALKEDRQNQIGKKEYENNREYIDAELSEAFINMKKIASKVGLQNSLSLEL